MWILFCRLLELGFEKAVSDVIALVNNKCSHKSRQNMLVSATLSSGITIYIQFHFSNLIASTVLNLKFLMIST